MFHPKVAQPDHEIVDLITRRWSPRAFDASRDVAREDLLRLFEAARWAPSSFNEQPWRFVVARRADPAAFAALLRTLTARNQEWAQAAPVLALVAVRSTLERNDVVNAHAWYDTGQAVANLTLQATAIGISVRQMQGFDIEAARAAVQVAPPFEPAVIMVIGYAGSPETLSHPPHRDAEQAPRSRRPVSEFVFDGTWGRSLR
ncbi:MAG TPA: nitroreductase family protein [Vicinamibacterales bacterium]|nr:nitroreductase family protein [Vicinamibacterales bacterium]